MIRFPRGVAPGLLAAALLLAAPASAQEAGWDGEAELGANIFFGNQDQSLINARLELGHADSTWDFSGGSRYTFGKSTDADGDSRLTHRSWNLGATADYLPFATVSYFGVAGAESSFQREIDLRLTGGAGVKYTFVRSDASLFDTSVALLAERTTFDVDPDPPVVPDPENPVADELEDTETLARWSMRVRARRSIDDDRITFESTTFWRPVFDEFDRYVVESTNSAAYAVTENVKFKVSLVDTYDSEAEDRGAGSNNDGQLLISLVGAF